MKYIQAIRVIRAIRGSILKGLPMKRFAISTVLFVCCGAVAAQAKTITVAADGSGDFKTVQEAIAAVPDNSDERTVIHIKAGAYLGPIIVGKAKLKVTFEGEGPDKSILTWDRNVNDPAPKGTGQFDPGLQVQGNDFTAENLTIQNTSGDHGQALAMRLDNDRSIIRNCRITGWQDTLMINNGRDYFADCYIAGRVDFIYGSATAWFENCEIHSRNGGHVTAASTPEEHSFGYIFHQCKLTGDATAWDPATTNPSTTQKPRVTPIADLGRPWRAYASVTYINCEMGQHIKPEGWNNWGKADNEKTARYAEYNTTGPGANPDKRYKWTKQLTKEEADGITVDAVLSGDDHWNPLAQLPASRPAP
jgi:pectinesterase